MKRTLRPDEAALWERVALTTKAAKGRAPPQIATPLEPSASLSKDSPPVSIAQPVDLDQLKRFGDRGPSSSLLRVPAAPPDPQSLDARRRRRIARERDPIEARLDLHGLDHDAARLALERFILKAHAGGARAVLVITGKGLGGTGVIRRFAPDWLKGGALRPLIAGVAEADRRHGGEGALYVALKRNKGVSSKP